MSKKAAAKTLKVAGGKSRAEQKGSSRPRQELVKNRILKSLPLASQRRLLRDLEEVHLSRRDVLQEPGGPLRYVYFPETAILSLSTVLQDGSETEVGSIGCEGMAGLAVFLGAKKSEHKIFCQMPGTVLRLSAPVMERETRRGGALADALQGYSLALLIQLAQLATCRRWHTIEQRVCCWLLMTHDRITGDAFPVTHEFLSQMLSARRSGVTVIAGTLQRAGLIRYRRGEITILDREGLERVACECYGVVRRSFRRLLG